jgi:DNA-binding transcriptional ArsR family regulator
MNMLTPIFAALSDDTRFRLVEHLMAEGEQPAGSLTELAGLSAPAVSRHLKVLREAGLLDQRVQGTHRFYSVRPQALRAISDWTIDHRAFWSASLDRLDTLLALDPEENT